MTELNQPCPICGERPLIRIENGITVNITQPAQGEHAIDLAIFYCSKNGHAVLLQEKDVAIALAERGRLAEPQSP